MNQKLTPLPVPGANLNRMNEAFAQSGAGDLVDMDNPNVGDIMLYCSKLEQRLTLVEQRLARAGVK